MKQLLFVGFAFIALIRCTPIKYSEGSSYFDYKEIKEKTGIALNQSNAVPYNYEALGEVSSYSSSGQSKVSKKGMGIYKFKDADSYNSLILLCNKAKEFGADEIINLKSEYIKQDKTSFIIKCIWTGMAIKRK